MPTKLCWNEDTARFEPSEQSPDDQKPQVKDEAEPLPQVPPNLPSVPAGQPEVASGPVDAGLGGHGVNGDGDTNIDFDKVLPFMRTLLKPHQCDGVKRMLELEAGSNHGGILADEMGLGKTIQYLSLVALGKDQGDCLPTLLVVPGPSVLKECEAEILKHTKLSFQEFHGVHRPLQPGEFRNFDIVITTYDMLRQDLSPSARTIQKSKTWFREFRAISNDELRAMKVAAPLFEQDWERIILDEAQ